MRALVTGIDGFVGPWLADELRRHGYDVIGVTRRSRPPGEDLLTADLVDPAAVGRAVRQARPDFIFHLAGLTFVPDSWKQPMEYFRVNVASTIHLLEAVRELAPRARFVLAGSSEVYGFTLERGGPVCEKTLCQPASPYAVSKLAADLTALDYQRVHGVDAVRMRPFNHTGPGQRESFVLPSFARQIALAEAGSGPSVIQVGNLDVTRSFTDVRDIARAYRLAAELGRAGACYNVGHAPGYLLRDLLAGLVSMARVPMQVVTDPDRVRPVDVPSIECDASAFAEATGWRAEITMERTLRDLLEYWRDRSSGRPGRTLEAR